VTARFWLLTLFFTAALHPYQYGALSVNYLFACFPVILCLVRGAVVRPPRPFMALIGVYVGIVIVASIYQFSYVDFTVRRFASFFLFMTMFLYMFIRIDTEMVRAFKVAVIIISLYLSLEALMTYLAMGGAALGSSAKNVVGTQRVGFIYLVAVWLVYLERYRGRLWAVCKYPVLVVLVIGLLITFSRASVFALLGSVFLYAFFWLVAWMKRPKWIISKRLLASIVLLPVVVYAVTQAVPATITFFDQSFLQLLLDRDRLTEHLYDPRYSEGFRLAMTLQVIEFATWNPFTGSGFLGVWVLSADQAGSTHNQLTDVLFRTGWVGLVVHVYLLFRLLKFLAAKERPLFWGVVGMLLYGLYHETFKESQGAFVFAFLLGLMSQRRISFHGPSKLRERVRSDSADQQTLVCRQPAIA
jgi:hypothetical protein